MSSIATMTDPSTRLALANLRLAMTDDGTFSDRAIASVIAYARDNGCLEGCPYVRAEELDRLTDAFVGGFEPVDYSDPAWGDVPPEWDDTRLCPCGRTSEADPCTCDDEAELSAWLASLDAIGYPPSDQVEPNRLGTISRAAAARICSNPAD